MRKVLLQISDDFLKDSVKIVSKLKKNSSALIFTVGNTVHQNCCNDVLSIDHLKLDAYIHIGNACFSCNNDLPTFYIFPKQEICIDEFCKTFVNHFGNETENILLYYDVKYAHVIVKIYETIKPKYKNIILSRIICDSNISALKTANNSNPIIIGRSCDVTINFKGYDGFYLGPNNHTFQSLAISLPVRKWHYYQDLKVSTFDLLHFPWLKKKNYLIEKIRDSKRFGLLIASLNVSEHVNILESTKTILKKMSKKIYTFSVGKVNPSKLANFQEVDVYIIVSCPENSLMDTYNYYKPVVTPFDIELAFNEVRNSVVPYSIDFRQILPEGINYKVFQSLHQPDVSLINGTVRNFGQECLSQATSLNYLKQKVSNHIEKRSVSLENRWDGLQCEESKKTIALATRGRDGIPIKYFNESSMTKVSLRTNTLNSMHLS
ncbi:2-(3-amino-3-carboxypropyl)histidine synthase subunit 2 [Copidosoma floridanum]|uniref:2-(3-amino-3-carboxypropyl)histidine synthase subunit 2 n=1 Tax=Copidosoma floridanum TaxID=29053 RepID=UPI000C6F7792|nr:2-(3-amino-3-carboxypropyl)histidine synthase subunit 2 [Copidosoma floridanum]